MFQYAIDVLRERKGEIEKNLAGIYEKQGGLLAVLEAQRQIQDISDALEVLEGIVEDLKRADLLSEVEGNAKKEALMSFDSEEEAFE